MLRLFLNYAFFERFQKENQYHVNKCVRNSEIVRNSVFIADFGKLISRRIALLSALDRYLHKFNISRNSLVNGTFSLNAFIYSDLSVFNKPLPMNQLVLKFFQ